MKEKLLPNYFKKIGFILGILVIVFFIKDDWTSINHNIYNSIIENGFMLAFLLIAFSKEKNESEEIMKLRYVKLKSAVLFGAVLLITDAVIDWISNSNVLEVKSGYEILFAILFFYIATFNLKKYAEDQARS